MEQQDQTSLAQGWRVKFSQSDVYTGGKVEFDKNGSFFVSQISDNVGVVSVSTGRLLFKLVDESGDDADDVHVIRVSERITTFCLHPDGYDLVTASENQLLRRWDLKDLLEKKLKQEESESVEVVSSESILLQECVEEFPTMVRAWKGHSGPISCADFHPQGDMFATGSSDFTVKVWNLKGAYCTHNFKSHQAILTTLKFHPEGNKLLLASGDHNGDIFLWNLMQQTDSKKQRSKHTPLKNHVAAVTSICFGKGDLIFTSARDKVVNVWEKDKLLKTHPVLESVEGMQLLNSTDELHELATAGEKGVIRVWSYSDENEMSCIRTEASKDRKQFMALLRYGSQLVGLTLDAVLHFCNAETLQIERQIPGHHDEIIDLQYLDRTRVVMATNSENVSVINLDTFNTGFFSGHSDLVLSLDVSKDGNFILTGSKDNTCRVWSVSTLECVGVCKGHAQDVTAVSFLQLSDGISKRLGNLKKRQADDGIKPPPSSKLTPAMVVTGSADKTLKFWSMYSKGDIGRDLVCRHTQLAHEKAINTISASPNRMLVASGSQDKTIKLWQTTESYSFKGILRGHRRGVWDVRFSPIEKCLVSASADKTLRIWSISDLSCLSVLEGHSTSVLRVQYSPCGSRVYSTASNGIIKVWSVHGAECVGTLECHTDKVWALAVSETGKEMISGGGDSNLVLWKDCTKEVDLIEKRKQEEYLLHEQELYNCIRNKDYLKAARRALELNRPHRLRTTLEAMMSDEALISKFLSKLDDTQRLRCWELARDWNMYARNCPVAHIFVKCLLQTSIPLGSVDKIKAIIEPFQVYSERHIQRLDRLIKDSFIIDHTLACMNE